MPMKLHTPGTRGEFLAIPISVWLWFLVFVTVSLTFPQIDLWVSSLFFTPGVGFEIKGVWWERIIYRSIGYVVTILTLGLIATWLYNRLRHRRLLGLDTRKLGVLIGLLVLVPGLLVNLGLKEHVGRARAVNLEQFGGDARFTPAFVPSDQEGGSFSSGHAATGFWVVAVAYGLSGRFGPWAVVALVYAVVLSLARIASGGHFPSDVLASAFFVLMGWFVLCALTRPRGEA